ncbi:MAG: phage tail-type lysozyme domain-containing protein [Clostridiales bacterium]|nr:phage tail-type lysozyme domain-containing protein [Clostridiales bacterium]
MGLEPLFQPETAGDFIFNIASDSAGYGLAQWTYKTRKKNLKDYCDTQGTSIGDLNMQLEFLWKELSESYTTVLSSLKNATSVLEASNVVLTKFEKPANQGTTVQNKRAGYGQTYYDKYSVTSTTNSSAVKTATDSAQSYDETLRGTYQTTVALYMRNGAGKDKTAMVVLPKNTDVKCYGYYTTVNDVKWLYVQATYKGIKYSGFCASTYLSKQ